MAFVLSQLRRTAAAAAVVLAVSVLVFAATSALPGDGIRARLGPLADPAHVRAERIRLGLDRPLPDRYAHWLTGILHGDLGHSYSSGLPVRTLLAPALADSLVLAATALVVAVPLGAALGTWAGLRPGGRADRALLACTLAGAAVPMFVTAALLVTVFAVRLRWLPALSLTDPARPLLAQPAPLVLPVATLVLGTVSYVVRLVRAKVVDADRSEWALAARLRGVPERTVVLRHVLPAAGPVLCQTTALTATVLVGGAVVVENVFAYPGVGQLLQNAVATRDVPVVQAVAVAVACQVVAVTTAADAAARLLGPRRRHPS